MKLKYPLFFACYCLTLVSTQLNANTAVQADAVSVSEVQKLFQGFAEALAPYAKNLQAAALDAEASNGTAEKPNGGTAEKPSGGTAEKPSGGTAEKPNGGTAEKPSGGTAEKPNGGTSEKPSEGTAEKPSGGAVEKPNGGGGGGGASKGITGQASGGFGALIGGTISAIIGGGVNGGIASSGVSRGDSDSFGGLGGIGGGVVGGGLVGGKGGVAGIGGGVVGGGSVGSVSGGGGGGGGGGGEGCGYEATRVVTQKVKPATVKIRVNGVSTDLGASSDSLTSTSASNPYASSGYNSAYDYAPAVPPVTSTTLVRQNPTFPVAAMQPQPQPQPATPTSPVQVSRNSVRDSNNGNLVAQSDKNTEESSGSPALDLTLSKYFITLAIFLATFF